VSVAGKIAEGQGRVVGAEFAVSWHAKGLMIEMKTTGGDSGGTVGCAEVQKQLQS